MQHAPQDPPVLRHPDNFGVHREVNLEAAANMLIRALTMITQTPFTWCHIDKPLGRCCALLTLHSSIYLISEGQVHLLFLPQHVYPNDGIRWQEMETKYVVPVMSNTRVRSCRYSALVQKLITFFSALRKWKSMKSRLVSYQEGIRLHGVSAGGIV
jgi:hypothetical protein